MAADNLEEARRRLEDEFGQVRRHLDRIWEAMREVERAGPEDDLYELLGRLEDRVKEVRTGGVVGSGAHGHKRALERFRELSG
jgi:hypothetical protein